MKKLAVDVVLLPPESITEKTIEINREILKTSGDEIELDSQTCLPHISLAMGCIDESDLGKIAEILQKISKEFLPLSLQAVSIYVEKIPTGKKCSTLVIENSEKLQRLHEEAMAALKSFLTQDPTLDSVYGYPAVDRVTLYWIKNYFEKSSFKNFKPHITVGLGEAEVYVKFPIFFTASTLALCHLGNYCTCRKILASMGLQGN